jgi:hypothetical protein
MEELVPPLLERDVRLTALLDASRGIVLPKMKGHGVKLSPFSQKQLARRNPLKAGKVRSGLVWRKPRTRMSWQTQRKVWREKSRREGAVYRRYKKH